MLRTGSCHSPRVSQLSFNTLIYKRRRGRDDEFIWKPHLTASIVFFPVTFKSPFLKNFKDVSLIVIRESTNHNHSAALTESGTTALDEGTFITGKRGDNRGEPRKERKVFFFFFFSSFFQTHFPLLAW